MSVNFCCQLAKRSNVSKINITLLGTHVQLNLAAIQAKLERNLKRSAIYLRAIWMSVFVCKYLFTYRTLILIGWEACANLAGSD